MESWDGTQEVHGPVNATSVASVSVLALGVCRGIEMVISVPGDVARTSHCPPAASAFARIDARPI